MNPVRQKIRSEIQHAARQYRRATKSPTPKGVWRITTECATVPTLTELWAAVDPNWQYDVALFIAETMEQNMGSTKTEIIAAAKKKFGSGSSWKTIRPLIAAHVPWLVLLLKNLGD